MGRAPGGFSEDFAARPVPSHSLPVRTYPQKCANYVRVERGCLQAPENPRLPYSMEHLLRWRGAVCIAARTSIAMRVTLALKMYHLPNLQQEIGRDRRRKLQAWPGVLVYSRL